MLKQTLKDVENIYRNLAAFDMSYDHFNKSRSAWKNEDYNYIYNDTSK